MPDLKEVSTRKWHQNCFFSSCFPFHFLGMLLWIESVNDTGQALMDHFTAGEGELRSPKGGTNSFLSIFTFVPPCKFFPNFLFTVLSIVGWRAFALKKQAKKCVQRIEQRTMQQGEKIQGCIQGQPAPLSAYCRQLHQLMHLDSSRQFFLLSPPAIVVDLKGSAGLYNKHEPPEFIKLSLEQQALLFFGSKSIGFSEPKFSDLK